jgi:hypothetical protein
LLNVDQPLGHLRFSSQILLSSEHRRLNDLAAVGSGGRILGRHRDNRGDSYLTLTLESILSRQVAAEEGGDLAAGPMAEAPLTCASPESSRGGWA